MLRYSRAKIAAVLLLVVAGFLYAAPSLMSPETRAALREATPGFLPSWLMPHQAIVLGLDLQGGSHVLLEVDSAAVLKTQVATLRDDMRRILRDEKIALAGGLAILPRGVSVRITDEAERKRVVPKLRELVTPTSSIMGGGGQAASVATLPRSPHRSSLPAVDRCSWPALGFDRLSPVCTNADRLAPRCGPL